MGGGRPVERPLDGHYRTSGRGRCDGMDLVPILRFINYGVKCTEEYSMYPSSAKSENEKED